jgi:hypothetical protein
MLCGSVVERETAMLLKLLNIDFFMSVLYH